MRNYSGCAISCFSTVTTATCRPLELMLYPLPIGVNLPQAYPTVGFLSSYATPRVGVWLPHHITNLIGTPITIITTRFVYTAKY